MTRPADTTVWNRLSVGRKLATIPALFIAATVGILLFTVITCQGQKSDSYVVFISSRQRMLVQRQFVQVVLVARGVPIGRDMSQPPAATTL